MCNKNHTRCELHQTNKNNLPSKHSLHFYLPNAPITLTDWFLIVKTWQGWPFTCIYHINYSRQNTTNQIKHTAWWTIHVTLHFMFEEKWGEMRLNAPFKYRTVSLLMTHIISCLERTGKMKLNKPERQKLISRILGNRRSMQSHILFKTLNRKLWQFCIISRRNPNFCIHSSLLQDCVLRG